MISGWEKKKEKTGGNGIKKGSGICKVLPWMESELDDERYLEGRTWCHGQSENKMEQGIWSWYSIKSKVMKKEKEMRSGQRSDRNWREASAR
jgi:hypothetical protein